MCISFILSNSDLLQLILCRVYLSESFMACRSLSSTTPKSWELQQQIEIARLSRLYTNTRFTVYIVGVSESLTLC